MRFFQVNMGHRLPVLQKGLKQGFAGQSFIEAPYHIACHSPALDLPKYLFATGIKQLIGRELQAAFGGILYQFMSHVEFGRVSHDGQLGPHAISVNGRPGLHKFLNLVLIEAA
jgi:hypothetical protein